MISPKWAKGISPAPRPSEGQGKPLEGGGYGRPLFGILSAYFVCQRVTGTLGRPASGPFLLGKGACFGSSSGPISHTSRLLFPPQVFFFLAFEARSAMDCQTLCSQYRNSESCSENTLQNPETPRIV